MKREIKVVKMDNGDWMSLGRHASYNGVRGEGPAVIYTGEDARILDRLLLGEYPK